MKAIYELEMYSQKKEYFQTVGKCKIKTENVRLKMKEFSKKQSQ